MLTKLAENDGRGKRRVEGSVYGEEDGERQRRDSVGGGEDEFFRLKDRQKVSEHRKRPCCNSGKQGGREQRLD